MKQLSQNDRYEFTLIAETGDRFIDFAPYVASINGAGRVAFQAALRDGGSGVFASSGGPIDTISASGPLFREVISHPDINSSGDVCFYADHESGGQSIIVNSNGMARALADTEDQFRSIGPLGPTMNESGAVAFRAVTRSGDSGIFVTGLGEGITTIADTGPAAPFSGFDGLPVINDSGAVAFRADLTAGGQGVYLWRNGSITTIAQTGTKFRELWRMACLNDVDAVAFSATFTNGGAGIFVASDGEIATIAETNSCFKSFRGPLINNGGRVMFPAELEGGKIGIFSGPDPETDRIIAFGDSLFGSDVVEIALNSVSFNDAFQLAIRAKLADGRQLIIRADRR